MLLTMPEKTNQEQANLVREVLAALHYWDKEGGFDLLIFNFAKAYFKHL